MDIGKGIFNFPSGYLSQLRYPWLFLITILLFIFDLVIPDVLPFVDEIILGLLAAIFSKMKKEKSGKSE